MKQNDAILTAIKSLADEIVELVHSIMSSEAGVNKKIGKNTLIDSEVYRSVRSEINVSQSAIIDTLLNNYITDIEKGRPAGAKKIPINVLRDWASRKGISTDNSVLYAIQNAIFRDGIEGRPILARTFAEIERAIGEKIEYRISELISEQLQGIFED